MQPDKKLEIDQLSIKGRFHLDCDRETVEGKSQLLTDFWASWLMVVTLKEEAGFISGPWDNQAGGGLADLKAEEEGQESISLSDFLCFMVVTELPFLSISSNLRLTVDNRETSNPLTSILHLSCFPQ